MTAPRTVEVHGRTVEEAVAQGLHALRALREEVDVVVLQDPKPALLGFGGRDARVRLTLKPGPVAVAEEIATRLIGLMGLAVQLQGAPVDAGEIVTVMLEGPDVARLTGGHGRMLDALEHLIVLLLTRRLGKRVPLVLDADGYRRRHDEELSTAARADAEKAVQIRQAVRLKPMGARDRRVIHLALKDDARVATMSEGDDNERHVVITPVGLA